MWQGLWIAAPVLGAFVTHVPVLRFGWLRSLARPLDGGATFRGQRILGDNKTWRGALCMFVGVFGATLLLAHVSALASRWPGALRAHVAAYAALLGLGFVVGELPNSFVKRQLAIAPGKQRHSPLGVVISIFDQADFVPMVWLALLPLYRMSLLATLTLFAVTVAVHLFVNVLGYAIGARKELL